MIFVQGTNPIVQLQQAFVEPLQQLSGFVEEITQKACKEIALRISL